MNALNQAIDIIGGQTKLAQALGTSAQAVNNWTRRGSVPPQYAPVIESLTGRRVLAEDLCPNVPWQIVRADDTSCATPTAQP